MTSDPVLVALREIAQTKHLVEALVLSSRSIDYMAAEAILQALERKVRTLGKIQARLMAECTSGDRIVPFPSKGCTTHSTTL